MHPPVDDTAVSGRAGSARLEAVEAASPPAPTAAASSHPWRRSLLLALLVVAAGVVLGAAGFAVERRVAYWEPSVAATPTGGWSIAGNAGLRPVAPVLADGRLVWGQGHNTCVLDLDSGDPHVVGVAPRGISAWPPAADGHRVAWLETPHDAAPGGSAHLWAYDAEGGRRLSFAVASGATSVAVDGDLVVWLDEGRAPRVCALDLSTDRRSELAEGQGIAGPVLASDGLVGWLRRGVEGGGPWAVLRDVATGELATVRLAADGSGAGVGDVQLRGRILLWTVRSVATTTVMAYDVRAGVSSVVAGGDVESPATDGELVVWAAGGESTGSSVVRGRRLGGAEFQVRRLAAWPTSLAVGDGWLAWSLDGGASPSLQAERIGR